MGERNDASVRALEIRLNSLETKVFGSSKDRGGAGLTPKATDVLIGFSNRLGNCLIDSDRASMIAKRLEELESYIRPDNDINLMSSDQKVNELLTISDHLRSYTIQLDKCKELIKQSLIDENSEHIRNVPNLVPELCQLYQTNTLLGDEINNESHSISQLIEKFNRFVTTIVQALIETERAISDAERAMSEAENSKFS